MVPPVASLCEKRRLLRRQESGSRGRETAPNIPETHFWLAECLRQLNMPEDAEHEYEAYLHLSSFQSTWAGKLDYVIIGSLIGAGKKKCAAQQDIWKELQGQAHLGICDCEWMRRNIDSALSECQTALSYDPNGTRSRIIVWGHSLRIEVQFRRQCEFAL